ncbi:MULTISPECIES: hypothetical protein [unclassified Devosia]|uniref:DUF6894 family protein n=1 Tax=unclassified Devosia TaxID=196773 RepID=UPI0015556145|nr:MULTISPECIES: hypothetical protein [unclassified Devosia]
MPLYFFDTDDGDVLFRDEIGSDLASDHAARDEASSALAELAKDHIPGAYPQKNITMWVRNEEGEPILQLALSFAIRPLK